VVTLTPDKARLRTARSSSWSARTGQRIRHGFISTAEGKEGPAIWLAKRGITFVALTRVGRWNFWRRRTTALGKHSHRQAHAISTATRRPLDGQGFRREAIRLDGGRVGVDQPRLPFSDKGTLLEKQMLAATPRVFIEGYKLALEKAIPDRNGSLVLFWGMSTGGASLYPLAKYFTPDGYLGWGTSSTRLAYVEENR